MRRTAAALTLMCACNQVYGIETTALFDGTPADAPFQCPQDASAPQFKRLLTQYLARNCGEYTLSRVTGRAVAACYDVQGIVQGNIDGDLDSLVSLINPASGGSVRRPRLSGDGEELWVQKYDPTLSYFVEIYKRGAGEVWSSVGAAPSPAGLQPEEHTSVTSAGPNGRMFLITGNLGRELVEYRETGTTWSIVRTYDPMVDLGVTSVTAPWLSADGRRMMVTTSSATTNNMQVLHYGWRASIDVAFTTLTPLPTTPPSYDAFLDTDCGRLYVSGLASVFYAQQL